MSISESLRTSLPRHGGFYLLHPTDSRVLLNNVRQILTQQEHFQLWCQHQASLLTHCLRLLVDLEYNINPDNSTSEFETNDHYDYIHNTMAHITTLRTIYQALLTILRRYRFDHHRPDHFHRVPTQLYHRVWSQLNDSQMNCRELPPRTRSLPPRHRWRTYPRTALPYDYQMWQRGLYPQFDPASDSDS